jgi:hypothetical protein
MIHRPPVILDIQGCGCLAAGQLDIKWDIRAADFGKVIRRLSSRSSVTSSKDRDIAETLFAPPRAPTPPPPSPPPGRYTDARPPG